MIAKQLQPSHASNAENVTEKNIKLLFESNQMIAQPKYDGERMLVHFDEGWTFCTSRRISSKTKKFNETQDNFPSFHARLDLGYTVLDGEIYSKDWSTSAGMTKSLPERAIELQKENQARYAAFDCLFFDGIDIRDLPYSLRLSMAKTVIQTLNKEHMHITRSIKVNSREHGISLMDEYIDKGFEGIVMKHLDKAYYDRYAILKLKQTITVDCVVYNIVQGNGKYSNTVGALQLGYFDSGEIVHITNCSPGTDADRDMWRDEWPRLKHTVVEVKAQEVTKRSLRHPVILRLRHDKSYEMCTRDTIFGKEEL